jgi:hypothetical protein
MKKNKKKELKIKKVKRTSAVKEGTCENSSRQPAFIFFWV